MKPTLFRALVAVAACALAWPAGHAFAQGVTTSEITGTVRDPQDLPVPGSTIIAVHEPSGTRYEAVSRGDGSYTIPGMRVGGPYTVTATLRGQGEEDQRMAPLGLRSHHLAGRALLPER